MCYTQSMNDPALEQILSFTESPVAGENMEVILSHGDIEYPIGVYKITLNRDHHSHVRWHWHDELEYIFVEKGSGTFRISDGSYDITEGEALFINQGMLQDAHVSEGYDTCVYYSIIFHPTNILAYGLTRLCSKYLTPILSNSKFHAYKITDKSTLGSEILAYIIDIVAINRRKDMCYELLTKEHLIHIWVLLFEFMNINPAELGDIELMRLSLDESRSKDAVKYIEKHYSEPITLTDIADSIHVSKNECCRCIKRCMGMTPFEYLLSYRIYRAAALLREASSADSIADIAIKVGFNNTSYFNKVFKKHMGCTPKEYRSRDTYSY